MLQRRALWIPAAVPQTHGTCASSTVERRGHCTACLPASAHICLHYLCLHCPVPLPTVHVPVRPTSPYVLPPEVTLPVIWCLEVRSTAPTDAAHTLYLSRVSGHDVQSSQSQLWGGATRMNSVGFAIRAWAASPGHWSIAKSYLFCCLPRYP